MYGVELYAAVRLAVVDEGLSHHEAGRRSGIGVVSCIGPLAPHGFRVALIRRRNDREGGATRATPDSPPMAALLSRRYGGVSRR